jgi:hypothetical protein
MARKRKEVQRRFLVDVPTPYNPTVRPNGTADVPWGRAWTLAENGEQIVVEVEASAAALEAYVNGTLPKTGRLAIQTEGRSAIESHLEDHSLPRQLKITAAGVRTQK